jgi:hypothetical protein
MALVLSGAAILVLSGAELSCYQAQEMPENRAGARACARRNLSNQEFVPNSLSNKPSETPLDKYRNARHTR